jgi:hypothetical protein
MNVVAKDGEKKLFWQGSSKIDIHLNYSFGFLERAFFESNIFNIFLKFSYYVPQ